MHNFFSADPHHSAFYFVRLALGLTAGLLVLAALQLIPPSYRKRAIMLVTFLGGAFYALEFFWPVKRLANGAHGNFLTPYLPVAGTLITILQASAAGLGIISLLGLHLRNTARRREGWGYSVVLISAFFAMLIWGLLNAYNPHGQIMPQSGGRAAITNEDVYDVLFYGGFAPLNSAMFALIGFFIVSASYRAFRIRSLEATLLMAAAVIVMLGQVTLGTAITHNLPLTGIWSNFRLENLQLYILNQINAPAMRGIYFGIGVGFLATSLRLWLSLERGVYFDSEL